MKIIIVVTLKDAAWLNYRRNGDIVEMRSLFTGTVEQMLEKLNGIEDKTQAIAAAYSVEILRQFQERGIEKVFWLNRFPAQTFVRWNGLYEANRALIKESPAIQFKSLLSEFSLAFSGQTMSASTGAKLIAAWQEFSPPFVAETSRELR